MTNSFEAFGDDGALGHDKVRKQRELAVLVVVQGKSLLGVQASSVDSVVPWQRPQPLPQGSAHVLGVIQDRGRLVAVHRHADLGEPPQRLIVCATTRGLIGIAATETRHIGGIVFDGEVRSGVPTRTSAGDLTLIDVEDVARQMTDGAPA